MREQTNFAKNFLKNKKKGSFFVGHLESQKHAWRGLMSILKEEPNFRIELGIAVFVILAGIVLGISPIQMVIIMMTIVLVLFAEIVNSITERLCDIYTKDHHIGVKFIKDVAAGGVLISALFSIIIGAVIFIPEILALFA